MKNYIYLTTLLTIMACTNKKDGVHMLRTSLINSQPLHISSFNSTDINELDNLKICEGVADKLNESSGPIKYFCVILY